MNLFYPVRYALIEAFTHPLIMFLNHLCQERIASCVVPKKCDWVYVVFPIVVRVRVIIRNRNGIERFGEWD